MELRGPEVHNRATSGHAPHLPHGPGDRTCPLQSARAAGSQLHDSGERSADPSGLGPALGLRGVCCRRDAASFSPREPSDPACRRRAPPPSPGRSAAARWTHLFEAEGHGEDTDPYYAVHYVHDQPPVGGGGRAHGPGSGARGPGCEAPGPPRGKGREALTGTGGCLEEAASREGGRGRQPADPARPRGHLMAWPPLPRSR